jgi:hypothetical protein
VKATNIQKASDKPGWRQFHLTIEFE